MSDTADSLIERLKAATGPDRELDRLLSFTFPEPMSGCWLWTGSAHVGEDGRFRPYFFMAGKQWLAHRASKWLHSGPFDLKAFICHHCDNPACVNPSHLYVGDHRSNMADMARRKRSFASLYPERAKEVARQIGFSNTRFRGARNPRAKLSHEQAIAIRADTRPTKVVAGEYGVDSSTIRRLRSGAHWRHLTAHQSRSIE